MKKRNDLLNRVSVDKPCSAAWDKMTGNDEARFCDHCVKHGHNLSAMTSKNAGRVINESNGNLCIR